MCNCINELEGKIIAEIKAKHPEKVYNENLNSWQGTGFENQSISFSGEGIRLYHEFKIESQFKKKNGDMSQPKKETINIYPTYCCFCGEKIQK